MSKLGTAISKMLAKIGSSNGTKLVETAYVVEGSNEEVEKKFAQMRLAHELFVAQRIASAATKRWDEAKEMCAQAGLLGDWEKLRGGQSYRTARLPNCTVDVVVDKDTPTWKIEDFERRLRMAGVSEKIINACKSESESVRRGNRKITITMLED